MLNTQIEEIKEEKDFEEQAKRFQNFYAVISKLVIDKKIDAMEWWPKYILLGKKLLVQQGNHEQASNIYTKMMEAMIEYSKLSDSPENRKKALEMLTQIIIYGKPFLGGLGPNHFRASVAEVAKELLVRKTIAFTRNNIQYTAFVQSVIDIEFGAWILVQESIPDIELSVGQTIPPSNFRTVDLLKDQVELSVS